MTNILVLEKGNFTQNMEFFRSFFKDLKRTTIDIISDPVLAKNILNDMRYNYVFIGDIPDVTWINDCRAMNEYHNDIVFYSMNEELVNSQIQVIPLAKRVPFHSLSQYFISEHLHKSYSGLDI